MPVRRTPNQFGTVRACWTNPNPVYGYAGGLRTAAFLSGGLIPPALRGTQNEHNLHIVDWHATFSALAGQPATDDPPTPPKAGDPSRPFDNIYGQDSFRKLSNPITGAVPVCPQQQQQLLLLGSLCS